jgi:ferric iron reductase protein FhuF
VHPLAATLDRGRLRRHEGRHLGARHGIPAAVGWTTTSRLCREAGGLRALLAAVGHDAGTTRTDVQASLFIEAYVWTLLLPVAGAVVAESRSPDLAADRVAVRFAPTGRPTDVAFLGPSWLALCTDDEAGHPDGVVLADSHVLAARLHDELVGHLRPLIAAVRRLAPRPEAALWRGAADRAAAAFLWAGEATGDRDRAERLATEVLTASPLRVRPRYRLIDAGGRTRPVHLRAGCCLWWRTRAGTPCITCPLTPHSRRDEGTTGGPAGPPGTRA